MDYHFVVVAHRVLVTAFLVHYVWKTFLLLSNKKDTLAAYTAKTRIAEMLVALLFMLSGFYMIYAGPSLSATMWIKIAMVFASIPIAIIGFRRNIKPMAIVAVLLLVGAYGLAEMNKAKYKKEDKAPVDTSTVAGDPVAVGKEVYTAKCVACHGDAGDAQLAGAKNLKITTLTDDQQKDIILHGKGGMSAFPLPDDQLNGVIAYLKTLKQ
ncbi:MAG: c-type cytochrome [Bacteroidetes bacterium]|nr:c-type cytochrome [Bacteroidota bacterium]MBS1685059.1 c-type cytochrome [Bacteroidota bacterium]